MGIFARKADRDSAQTLNNNPGYDPAAQGGAINHTTTSTHTSPRDAAAMNNSNNGSKSSGFFHRSTRSNDSTSSNEMNDMNGGGYGGRQSGDYDRGSNHGSIMSGNGMGLGNAGTGGTSINFSLQQAQNKLARATEHERVADQALAQSRASVREAKQEISALEREAQINLREATKMKKAGSKLGRY